MLIEVDEEVPVLRSGIKDSDGDVVPVTIQDQTTSNPDVLIFLAPQGPDELVVLQAVGITGASDVTIRVVTNDGAVATYSGTINVGIEPPVGGSLDTLLGPIRKRTV